MSFDFIGTFFYQKQTKLEFMKWANAEWVAVK